VRSPPQSYQSKHAGGASPSRRDLGCSLNSLTSTQAASNVAGRRGGSPSRPDRAGRSPLHLRFGETTVRNSRSPEPPPLRAVTPHNREAAQGKLTRARSFSNAPVKPAKAETKELDGAPIAGNSLKSKQISSLAPLRGANAAVVVASPAAAFVEGDDHPLTVDAASSLRNLAVQIGSLVKGRQQSSNDQWSQDLLLGVAGALENASGSCAVGVLEKIAWQRDHVLAESSVLDMGTTAGGPAVNKGNKPSEQRFPPSPHRPTAKSKSPPRGRPRPAVRSAQHSMR